jgi:multimeric flavodoxin WrbA
MFAFPHSMKAIVLSADPSHPVRLAKLAAVLDEQLGRAGYDQIEHFDVSEAKLGFCQGEFDCWVRHPGRCKIDDEEQAIVAAIPAADAIVYLGSIAFGGWNYALKRAIDRLICLITPFFEKRAGLTHHERRYESYPRMYAVGLLPTPDAEQQKTLEQLNDANASPMQTWRMCSSVSPWSAANSSAFSNASSDGSE